MKHRYVSFHDNIDVDIDVSIFDLLEELSDEELISEVKSRGLHIGGTNRHIGVTGTKVECKRYLCNVLGLNYYSSKSDIIAEINNLL